VKKSGSESYLRKKASHWTKLVIARIANTYESSSSAAMSLAIRFVNIW